MTMKKRTSRRLQQAARERMEATGENYTTALQAIRDTSSPITAAPPRDHGREQARVSDAEHAPDDVRTRD